MEKKGQENFFIWGTGKKSKEINECFLFEIGKLNIRGYIDNDSDKWGGKYFGKTVYSPEVLKATGKKIILILSGYKEEIKEQLINVYPDCDFELVDEEILIRMRILARYKNTKDTEIMKILNRLQKYPLKVFNYDFIEKYSNVKMQIEYDNQNQMFFSYYYEKKIYFSKKLDTEEKVREYYRSVLLEQDEKSPHLYITDQYRIKDNSVVIDAGVAEGNFSLEIIDRVKKIYLIESDRDWIEALKLTFSPYKDKVEIINVAASDYSDEGIAALDEIIHEKVDCIKMDIEGEELFALRGCNRIIDESDNIQCLICTYHQEFAYDVICAFLKEKGMEIQTSCGYMYYANHRINAPELRRGIVRARKRGNV